MSKIEEYRKKYPKGTILELTSPLEDPYSPKPAGARFQVSSVDDIGQALGSWLPPESGSIAIDLEHDNYKIYTETPS